jgi:hypothetical protein
MNEQSVIKFPSKKALYQAAAQQEIGADNHLLVPAEMAGAACDLPACAAVDDEQKGSIPPPQRQQSAYARSLIASNVRRSIHSSIVALQNVINNQLDDANWGGENSPGPSEKHAEGPKPDDSSLNTSCLVAAPLVRNDYNSAEIGSERRAPGGSIRQINNLNGGDLVAVEPTGNSSSSGVAAAVAFAAVSEEDDRASPRASV